MPLIDIVTMRGMIPRVADQLLPDEAAELAQDCAFDRGIITPLRDDLGLGVQLPFTPKTIFHYYGEFWFAWSGLVEVMRSPIAQDQYNRVYFTDGAYPKRSPSRPMKCRPYPWPTATWWGYSSRRSKS